MTFFKRRLPTISLRHALPPFSPYLFEEEKANTKVTNSFLSYFLHLKLLVVFLFWISPNPLLKTSLLDLIHSPPPQILYSSTKLEQCTSQMSMKSPLSVPYTYDYNRRFHISPVPHSCKGRQRSRKSHLIFVSVDQLLSYFLLHDFSIFSLFHSFSSPVTLYILLYDERIGHF